VARHLSLVRSDPGAPEPELPLELGTVDLGRIVSCAALSIWGEAENKVELTLQIDCVGPVVADEQRLVRLLRDLSRYLLTTMPDDLESLAPGQAGQTGEVRHVLRLRSRCHGPKRARVEVRMLLRGAASFPTLPALDAVADEPRVALWRRTAASFGAELHAESGQPPRALFIELDLAQL
jgi:hypothetical protein